MNPSQNAAQSSADAQAKSRRTIRTRLACRRCQRRKIRCDGTLPSCSACVKARVDCVDNGGQEGGDVIRKTFASFKDRIRWLESIVRTKCPEVDLTTGPKIMNTVLDSSTSEIESVSWNPTETPHEQPEGSISSLRPEPNETSPALQGGEQESYLPGLSTSDQPPGLAHEIGLVSISAGTDPKYIGPSSGFFFAKLLLAHASRQSQRETRQYGFAQGSQAQRFAQPRDAFHIPATPLPESVEHTLQLSETYFETVNMHYPVLHQPSFVRLVHYVYNEEFPNPIALFQVNMVLAISATVLSRRVKMQLSGEGFCANAMKHFDRFCIENSLKGLQNLLLLLLYTLNSPSLGLNVWYLNYQCIAALIDLGLQRDVKSSNAMSVLDQEMRTRIFWVIYTLDRTVATIMGRPIGLRDEACELRLPTDVDDRFLTETEMRPRADGDKPTHISNAIHLFKLAQLNSEIKYILHSISHDPPPYTYPRIPNIHDWQQELLSRLRQWLGQIPQFENDRAYIALLSEIKCHGVIMLLLRPSPAIRAPTSESLKICFESATRSVHLYEQLYRQDLLTYSWVTVHSIFLTTITMLHCIWVVPDIASQIKLDTLVADLKVVSNILSATGEHWSEAKRSRDILDELFGATIQWILDPKTRGATEKRLVETSKPLPAESIRSNVTEEGSQITSKDAMNINLSHDALVDNYEPSSSFNGGVFSQDAPNFDLYTSLFGNFGWMGQVDLTDPTSVNAIMEGVFNDVQPIYEFGQDFGFDQMMEGQFGNLS